eukprot:UN31269
MRIIKITAIMKKILKTKNKLNKTKKSIVIGDNNKSKKSVVVNKLKAHSSSTGSAFFEDIPKESENINKSNDMKYGVQDVIPLSVFLTTLDTDVNHETKVDNISKRDLESKLEKVKVWISDKIGRSITSFVYSGVDSKIHKYYKDLKLVDSDKIQIGIEVETVRKIVNSYGTLKTDESSVDISSDFTSSSSGNSTLRQILKKNMETNKEPPKSDSMSDDSFNRRPSADIVDSILRTDGSTSDKTSDTTAYSPKYDIKITIKKDLVRLSNKFDKFDFGGLADDDSEHLDSKRSPEAASKRSPESSSDKRDKWRALANKSGTLPTIKVSRSRSERATLSPTGSDGGFPRSLSEKTPPPVPGSLK